MFVCFFVQTTCFSHSAHQNKLPSVSQFQTCTTCFLQKHFFFCTGQTEPSVRCSKAMSGRTCSANPELDLTVSWAKLSIFLLNERFSGRRALIVVCRSLKACSLLDNYQSFGRRCCLGLQNKSWSLSCHATQLSRHPAVTSPSCHITQLSRHPQKQCICTRHSACSLAHPTTHSRTFSYARVTHVSSCYPFHTCSDQPTSWTI